MISLKEITKENLDAVMDLSVADNQRNYIASNAKSLAEAHFYSEAWYRAIYADFTLIGFVMLADETQNVDIPDNPKIMLWRLMIDEKHQKKGYGKEALQMVIEYAKSLKKFKEITLSFHDGDNSPEKFYLSIGFKHTGEMNEGEQVLKFEF